jgi:hypothetical protein
MDLSERFLAAEKAVDAHIATIQAAMQEVLSALARLEALVGDFRHVSETVQNPKPNGQGNLHGVRERICANATCARKFLPRNGRQIYHSRACAREAWERAHRSKSEKQGESAAVDAAGPCTG